jgi:hypothetical protein
MGQADHLDGRRWHSIHEVTQYLSMNGAPTPVGGRWHRATIRNIILSDTYLGLFYWGKKKVSTTTVSEIVDGVRTYKKKVRKEERPRSEWIAVPAPDSGIDQDAITRARERIDANTWAVSKNSGRCWEFSGDLAVCGACGNRMVACTANPSKRLRKDYYHCSNREGHVCPNRKNNPAGALETLVGKILADTLQYETWEEFVNTTYEQRIEDLRNMHGSISTSAGRGSSSG